MSRFTAGVDLGGTTIITVVAAPGGNVLGADRRPTPRRAGPDEVPIAVAASVHAAVADAGVDPTSVVAVGLGAPGQVDRVAGTVSRATTLPDWSDSFPLADTVASHVGRPVFLDNDVRLAVQAEIDSEVGRTLPSFLGVLLGTGVGAGVVLNGALWLGRGNAGEFGHTVVHLDGRICSCGARGCLQAYAGRAALEVAARQQVEQGRSTLLFDLMEFRDKDRLTTSVWQRAVAAGDPLAIELIGEAQHALGVAIGSAVNLLDVDGVVLGGGFAAVLGEPFRAGVAAAAAEQLLSPQPIPVRLTALGDIAGAAGAAALAHRRIAADGRG